jgi:hypothetical protein
MGGLRRRLEAIEAERSTGEARRLREELARLSDEELEALEERLEAEERSRGEQPPQNDVLEEICQEIERHGPRR